MPCPARIAVASLLLVGCSASRDPASGGSGSGASSSARRAPEAAAAGPPPSLPAGCTRDPGAPPVAVDAASAGDPIGSPTSFTLREALAGWSDAPGALSMFVQTEHGTIRCSLDEARAPSSVANFAGLARGTRPFRENGQWRVGRFYDGLTFHRVIPGFVIQGGDPLGSGTGGPGYDLVPENQIDEPLGTLAMAASDAPSGSQFYIVVGTGPAARYNVFGTCRTEVAAVIADVPRDEDDRPKAAVHMQRVDLARCQGP